MTRQLPRRPGPLVTEGAAKVLGVKADTAELHWTKRALCAEVGGDEFYPEKGGSVREAKAVCRGCEVRAECLAYALEHDERFGIWGGLSEPERRRLKRNAA
jgi:WhiB family redox-sensing transcriptional regulator